MIHIHSTLFYSSYRVDLETHCPLSRYTSKGLAITKTGRLSEPTTHPPLQPAQPRSTRSTHSTVHHLTTPLGRDYSSHRQIPVKPRRDTLIGSDLPLSGRFFH